MILFAIFQSAGTCPSSPIFSRRNRFKVIGVDARRLLAQVIYNKPIGYRANDSFIHDTMSALCLFAFGQSAVPVPVHFALPYPARGRVSSVFFDVLTRRPALAVARAISDVFALNMPQSFSSDFGDARHFSAATHTEAGRVRRCAVGVPSGQALALLTAKPLNFGIGGANAERFPAVITNAIWGRIGLHLGRLHNRLIEMSRLGVLPALPGHLRALSIPESPAVMRFSVEARGQQRYERT